MTLLLVDDNHSLTEFTSRNIRALRPGWTVLPAGSLSAARKIADNIVPVAAVIDVNLPDGNGFDLLADLMLCQPQLPVIMVTASFDEALHDRAREMGASTLIKKPYTIDSLVAAVESSMGLGVPVAPAAESFAVPPTALDLHEAQNRLSSLLVGIRAFAAEVQAVCGGKREVGQTVEGYVDRLSGIVMELSCMLANSRRPDGDDRGGRAQGGEDNGK